VIRRLKFVLLDLYETLAGVDWSPILIAREAAAARIGVSTDVLHAAYQRTLPGRMLGRHGGGLAGELEAILVAAGVDASPGLVADLEERELGAWRQAISLYPDVWPCLTELHARGLRMALVSNCSHLTRPLLGWWRLGEHFDAIVLSCEVGLVKPDGAVLELALARLGGEPGAALLVDDAEANLDTAAALGLAGCRMDRTESSLGGPYPVVSDMTGLLRLIG
jgi:putative hydrolase of the HAD superfamily